VPLGQSCRHIGSRLLLLHPPALTTLLVVVVVDVDVDGAGIAACKVDDNDDDDVVGVDAVVGVVVAVDATLDDNE
jgi:hypothetical protein